MIEEFMEGKLGGPIDKALDYAGMEGDIRRVVKPSDTQVEQLQYKTTQYQVRFPPFNYRNKSNMKFSHLKLILLTKVLITYLVSPQSSD